MTDLAPLLQQWGYLLLFAVGVAEFAGVPIASVPILVAAGAFVARGHLEFTLTVVCFSAGGLVGDALWYGLARWKGPRLVDSACSLATNPNACVLNVVQRLQTIGPGYLVPAKFVPGTSNLAAAAAGFARVRPQRFVLLDAIGLLALAMVCVAAGWLFDDQVGIVVDWLVAGARWVLLAVGVLVVAAAVLRYAKGRAHRAMHARHRERSTTSESPS